MKCKVDLKKYGLILISGCACVFFIFSFDSYYFSDKTGHHHYVYINISKAVSKVDDEFLSIALDTSFMAKSFFKLNSSDWKQLGKLSKLLTPAYLRLGGTAADLVIFNFDVPANDVQEKYDSSLYENYLEENISPKDYLNISGHNWIKFYNFVNESGLRLILDVNVLLRNGSHWDHLNAEQFLAFADSHEMNMDFQLGNEPNSFRHVFNISISGKQLAADFKTLKQILSTWSRFKHSKLIGPDVTRPKHLAESPVQYLEEFLSSDPPLDVTSWHHYYFNGRTATIDDFLNPKVLDVFPEQIKVIENVVKQSSSDIPIWLTETSSAYGGGAPGLSDTFASTFSWLDKLGMAAKMGLKVIVRQTLFQGYYSLIDTDLTPLPDFWISLFYKQLVGRKVLSTRYANNKNGRNLRFYASCLKENEKIKGNVILFGINMNNSTEYVIPGGLRGHHTVTSLIFTSENGNLTSKSILLNGHHLQMDQLNSILDYFNSTSHKFLLHMPPFSLVFWLFHGERQGACLEE